MGKIELMMSDLSDWIKEQVIKAIDLLVNMYIEQYESRLIGREELSAKLNVSPTTFDNQYRHLPDFPRELPACKWSLPAVNRWIRNQD
ncbi:helix-turn-helix transcriptional regulator [Streptococcus suis]